MEASGSAGASGFSGRGADLGRTLGTEVHIIG